MQKILFSDKYGLTEAVVQGTKTSTRRNTLRFGLGEVVAVAQRYEMKNLQYVIRRENDYTGRTYVNTRAGKVYISTKGFKNKMFVAAALMKYQIYITGYKEEKLQDISEEDALKEGIFETLAGDFRYPNAMQGFPTAREAFKDLIIKLNGKAYWESNPTVYAYDFRLIDINLSDQRFNTTSVPLNEKKKEFAIGEEFQLGLKRFRVEEESTFKIYSCIHCAFKYSYCCYLKEFTGECKKELRKDGKDVIFKEIRKK